jgi:predicted nucleic acid-binding protein
VKKARIYLDSSVVGGVYDHEFREPTRKLFERIVNQRSVAVISDLTLDELSGASNALWPRLQEVIESLPPSQREMVRTDEEMLELADAYIRAGVVGKGSRRDALHIAIATVSMVDVLVSWNFKHIVNLSRIKLYNSVNLSEGYPLLEIRSPREVIDEED